MATAEGNGEVLGKQGQQMSVIYKLSLVVVMVTGWVVLVGLLKGIDSDFCSRGYERHVAADYSIHGEVVVVVKATARLDD